MVTALTSVPAQAPAPPQHREEAFRRAVNDALTTLSGPDAMSRIMQLYMGDTRALMARADGLTREASEAAAQSRRHFDMLTQVQAAASHKIWEAAKMAAELSTYKSVLDTLRQMAERADGTLLEPAAVSAALSVEPAPSVHTAVTLAFVPSDQFRGGQFLSHPDADTTWVYTFIGWALVDHGPGALGCVEPMFLVEDRALPRSVIEQERSARLERYLPNLEPLRAA